MSKNASPARDALRAAITAKADAERAVEAACAAENHAFDRMLDARHALEELRQLPPDDPAQAYISALAEAHDVDVLELAQPATARATQAQRLENEIEALRETREALKRATASRRQEVERADFSVSQKALEVIKASDAAAHLIDGLDALQVEVAKRRASLRFLKTHGLLADDAKERVAELLCVDLSGDVRRSNAWALALEALARDASAPLPLEQGNN